MPSDTDNFPSAYQTDLHQIVRDSRALSDLTKKKYLKDLDHFSRYVSTVFGSDKINNPSYWSQKNVEAFHQHMLAKGNSEGTANGAVFALRYAAKWYALRENQPHVRNFPLIELPNLSEEKRDPLTLDEARRLLETTRGKRPRDLRDRALIVVDLETGMRRKSLQGMRWENFSESAGLRVCRVPIKRNKYGDEYDVPFSETALRALEPWRSWCKRNGVDVKNGPVFRSVDTNKSPARVGETGLSVDVINDIIANRAVKAGIGHKHPHQLRHTFVTWRLNDDVPAFAVMSVTGHLLDKETPAIMKRYSGVMVAERCLQATPDWLKALVLDLENS